MQVSRPRGRFLGMSGFGASGPGRRAVEAFRLHRRERRRLGKGGNPLMTRHTWTIEDRGEDLYLDQLDLQPGHVGGPAAGYHVVKRTLQTGMSKGVDVVEVDNGASVRRHSHPRHGPLAGGPGDVQLGWHSPVRGPVHPALVNLADEGGRAGSAASTSCSAAAAWRATAAGVQRQRHAPPRHARPHRQHPRPQRPSHHRR